MSEVWMMRAVAKAVSKADSRRCSNRSELDSCHASGDSGRY